MTPLKVKRAVVVCFLEAAKTTLEHLGAHRLAVSQDGSSGPPELPRTYGDVRRLRDYLQRCASVHQDPVELDMADSDQRLLVACCRRSVEVIDISLSGKRLLPPDESAWLRKKRQIVADWAFELAGSPLLELPLNPLSVGQPEPSRALLMRIHQKLKAEALQKTDSVKNDDANVNFGEPPIGMAPIDEAIVLNLRTVDAAVSAQPAPTSFIDSSKLQDSRLRALIAMDLRSYERCLAEGDYRLAQVLLASVLEAALLDHVLPRRTEFGLTGSPDTWNPQGLLMRALCDQTTPSDRSLIGHLFNARSLLRPAVQMVTPTVVSLASFDSLRDFVQRALLNLGFSRGRAADSDLERDAPAKDLP